MYDCLDVCVVLYDLVQSMRKYVGDQKELAIKKK